MTPSLEAWPAKAKEAPPHEVRLTLDTNPLFQCVRDNIFQTVLQNVQTCDWLSRQAGLPQGSILVSFFP